MLPHVDVCKIKYLFDTAYINILYFSELKFTKTLQINRFIFKTRCYCCNVFLLTRLYFLPLYNISSFSIHTNNIWSNDRWVLECWIATYQVYKWYKVITNLIRCQLCLIRTMICIWFYEKYKEWSKVSFTINVTFINIIIIELFCSLIK